VAERTNCLILHLAVTIHNSRVHNLDLGNRLSSRRRRLGLVDKAEVISVSVKAVMPSEIIALRVNSTPKANVNTVRIVIFLMEAKVRVPHLEAP
jgi:hypothetical protein